ncbi:MAG: fatty acid desaturase [Verrucomicrobiota bacterium]
MSTLPPSQDASHWRQIVAAYQTPARGRALWQLANTLIPYAATWWLLYWAATFSWWLAVPLAVLAGGFLVRVFIIFHDCGHGSFFKSPRANTIIGFLTGVLTFTPFHLWRREHALHHSTAGNLDKRGVGDVWTLTVQEYLEASRWKRIAYRLARNPLVLFLIAPLFLFLVKQRFCPRGTVLRDRLSLYATNLALLGVGAALSAVFGLKTYLLLQLMIVAVAGSAGLWLFYVQHQFDGVYWERGEEWDFTAAALQGSSFYELPKVLQWFSGNIGFHHIHHLSARIPNYHLERCHKAASLFQEVKPITLLSSLRSLTFRLWDEQRRKLVGYGALKHARKHARLPGPSAV